MAKFLIDANLPYRFSLRKGDNDIHQYDINDEWTDPQIRDYAKENNLTIVTEDGNFSNRIIFHEPPPTVIHIHFGNLTMREFFTVITAIWNDVIELRENHKLVNVFRDRIEAIE